nr:MAG TPA: protein of unknown function (DUF3560) [Caudoviricetes sp.]
MTDKNNRPMKTGDVVEITGAYFKNDNGLYFVEHTPGDPNWSGRDHCLRRIKCNGELSTAKDNICFWPIHAFVNSRDKRAAANQWNQEHAEIEIKTFPHTEHIAKFFAAEADSLDATIKRYTWDFGEDCQTVKDTKETQAFYRSVADGLRTEQPTAATEQPTAATEQPEQQTPATGTGAEAPAEQPEATTAEQAEQAEQPTPENRPETVPPYGSIDEETARNAHYCIHMSDYKPGSATASYRNAVNKAAQMVEQQKARVSAFYHDKLDALLNSYARRLAQWTNDYNRNQASYPSQFIAGAGNFNMRKHNRQMSREDSLWEEYRQIEAILDKIRSVGTGPVDLADPHAREMLTERLNSQRQMLEDAKTANAYYRKHKTLEGCPGLSEKNRAWLTRPGVFASGDGSPISLYGSPFPAYELASIRGKIERTEQRLAELDRREQQAAEPQTGTAFDGGQIVRNIDLNRLQILFDAIPDTDTRAALKQNGFRWSPKNQAWQRQLTDNAERAARQVLRLA